uniref:Uncharacterized protein n=1 Tax=Romanomermis culicivorax TaxID=13658 RepID=A0A915K2S4_ROMCU
SNERDNRISHDYFTSDSRFLEFVKLTFNESQNQRRFTDGRFAKQNQFKLKDFAHRRPIERAIYTCSFRRNGRDRQQLETFSLKINFRSEKITAFLRKTTDSKGSFILAYFDETERNGSPTA